MSEDKAGKANGPDAPDAPDAIERLLGESLGEPNLAKGLVERVMSALPPREAMRPVLHPALRAAYGVTAVVFAFAAWSIDLPARLGAGGTAGRVALGVFFFQAAIGAVGLGLALLRDVGPAAWKTLRAMFEGQKARPFVATVAAAVLVLFVSEGLRAAWGSFRWFPASAARASAVVLIFVLVAAAALQLWIMAKGRDWRPALRLVEAGGLLLAGAACALNYVIFVVV